MSHPLPSCPGSLILACLCLLGHVGHAGLGGGGLVRVGPAQYALQWLYAVSEPTILRLTHWLITRSWATDTLAGRLLLRVMAASSRFLPHGVVVTTEAACAFARFLERAEGPRGARLAVGPCVCQRALGTPEVPACKDVVLLYGAEIYTRLSMGYRVVTAEEACAVFEGCGAQGLVHTVDFCMQSGRWSFVVCNCDAEICVLTRVHALTGRFLHPGPAVVRYEPARCAGLEACGRCVPACLFGACTAAAGELVVDKARCMGCGRCAEVCPGALTMITRADYGLEADFPAAIFTPACGDEAADDAAK